MKFSELLDSTPKWKHSEAQVRLQAIQSNSLEDEILSELAQKDPETDVRIAAIQCTQNEEALNSLREDCDDRVKASAIDRLATLICDDKDALNRIARIEDPGILVQIARNAPELELKLKAVNRLKNEDTLEELLQEPNNARVHQLCAELINDPVRLERIHKLFLDKNKGVVQTTRTKLNRIKEDKAAGETFIAECESICNVLEKLASETPGDDFQRKLNYQIERWAMLPAAQSVDEPVRTTFKTLEERFQRAQTICQEILATAAAETQKRIEHANEITGEIEHFLSDLEQKPEKLDQLDTFLAEARHKWPDGFQDDNTLMEKYQRQTHYLDQIAKQYRTWLDSHHELAQLLASDQDRTEDIKRLLDRVQWPDAIPEPELLKAARARFDQLKQNREEQAAQRKARIQKFQDQLDQLDAEIQKGRLKAAKKLESALLKSMESANVSKKHQERFTALSIQLRELKDWQGFATAQKRRELCEKMETLRDDETIHPREKANAIKELQDSWKALGPSDSRENQRLWSRFKAAGDAAFEPCASYFEEQNKLREQNLRERERICESLELYLEQNDWGNPDWKGVNNVIHQAKDEWRRFQDVPNAARKKIQKRFSRVMDQLENKLKEEERRNETKKEELIQRVKSLLESDSPVGQLVAETKKIQSEWKEVGITRRAADQKLWKEFRAQCDLVFARRDQERSAQRESTNEQHKVAQAVIDELKSLMSRDDPLEKNELNQIRGQFKRIKLDRTGSHLEKEFNRLIKEAESLIKQQLKAGEMQMISELKRKAVICSRLETGDISAEEAEAQWDSEITIETDLAEQLDHRRRLAASGGFDAERLAKNQEAAELICVRMEILAGLESPPEASERRMQYQVERLNRGLSQGEKETRSPEAQLRDLQRSWYCLGPVAENGARLDQRFRAAEAVLEGTRPD